MTAARGGYHRRGLKDLSGDEIQTLKVQKKLLPGIISMIGDGCRLYMSNNKGNPKAHLSSCISVHNAPLLCNNFFT